MLRILSSTLLVLCACGSSPEVARPLPFAGGTLRAPVGPGWKLVEQKQDGIVFRRTLADDGHELTAMGMVFPFEFDDLEQCAASLRRDKYVESDRHRRPRGSVTVVADADPPYVLVRYAAEETDALGAGASWFALTSEFRWYLRSGDKRGIMLSFGERRPVDRPAAEYGAQARSFFAGFHPGK